MGESYQHAVPATVTGPDAPTEDKKTSKTPTADAVSTEVKTEQKPTRPDHIPEKFWDAEKGAVRTDDLLKSYAELEKSKGEKKVEEKAKPGDENKTPEQLKAEADAKAAAEAEKAKNEPELPKHLKKFNDEFAEKGELSEDSYKELAEKHGLSRDYVDTFIEGQKAKQAAYFTAVYAETGGSEEGFNDAEQWALANLPKGEIQAINEALTSGNKDKAAIAARGLYAKFQEANGKEPRLLGDGGNPRSAISPFKSTAEVVAAMSDPRYAKDASYRKTVDQRLEVSDVI